MELGEQRGDNPSKIMGFLKKAEKNFKHLFDRRSQSGEV